MFKIKIAEKLTELCLQSVNVSFSVWGKGPSILESAKFDEINLCLIGLFLPVPPKQTFLLFL